MDTASGSADRRFYAQVGSCTIWNNRTFWSYGVPEAMRMKRRYMLDRGLGGIMFRQIGDDSTDSELLRAIAGK
jgi:GH18 family chitinase